MSDLIVLEETEPETTLVSEPAPQPQTAAHVTVEHLLYLLVGVVAGIMRLTTLGRVPLSPAEATEALAVWGYWQADEVVVQTIPPGSPAYFSLTNFLSQVLGSHDAVMRLVPALFGIGLVLLPFLLRSFIGRAAALLASVLLAVSPTLTATARTASGDAIALCAALLILAAWLQYQQTEKAGWLYALFAALGLGLASAPVFYGGLVSLGIAWALHKVLGPPLFETTVRPARSEWRTAALIAGGTFLAAGTFFLWHLSGLGAAAELAAAWLTQFAFPGDLLVWLNPLLALGRYEAGALVLGTLIAAWATWRGDPVPTFLTYWFLGSLFLLLTQPGNLDNVWLVVLPGTLLIGVFCETLFLRPADWSRWPLGGLLLVLGAISAANLGRFARATLYTDTDTSNLALVFICILLGLLVTAFVFSWDRTAALQAIVAPLLLALIVYNWGNAWWLGQHAANDPRERWVAAATDDDVHLLAETIAEIARQTGGAKTSLSVFSSVTDPTLRWYLRDMPQIEYGTALPVGARYDLILTAESNTEPQFGEEYMGADFGLRRPPVDHVLSPTAALRWWFFRESPQPIEAQKVILWVRTDLVNGENG